MARPRNSVLSLNVTPYYHCTSRCVRGSFLCGVDRSTGCDYTHRRQWLRDRLLFLSDTFSIKIAAFAIMENHFHVVLYVDSKSAEKWSIQKIVKKWHKVFNGTELSQKFLSGEPLNEQETNELTCKAEIWRKNLSNVSWFMRCTKEPLARMANREDRCKGRFWDGRFHCQALLDTKSILACMTYVDLNPLRAKMCETPEEGKFTSLNVRLENTQCTDSKTALQHSLNFLSHENSSDNSETPELPLSIGEYLNIVDVAARVKHPDKPGVLSSNEVSIFKRLGFRLEQWISAAMTFNQYFHVFVGKRSSMLEAIEATGQSTAWGIRNCETLLGA